MKPPFKDRIDCGIGLGDEEERLRQIEASEGGIANAHLSESEPEIFTGNSQAKHLCALVRRRDCATTVALVHCIDSSY